MREHHGREMQSIDVGHVASIRLGLNPLRTVVAQPRDGIHRVTTTPTCNCQHQQNASLMGRDPRAINRLPASANFLLLSRAQSYSTRAYVRIYHKRRAG